MRQIRSLVSVPVIVIALLAFAVRYIYNHTVGSGYFPLHDSLTYQTIAYSLLRDHCFCYLPHLPTVDRAPLWPFIIAVIYGIRGPHDMNVRVFLCVVGTGTCLLIYFFARDMFGSRIALFAGLLAAIYPFLFIYDGWLYSESVYTFLLFAFCYTLYRLQRAPRWRLAILAGLLLGLLSLTRPNGLLILALIIAWLGALGLAKLLPWRKGIQYALLISAISLLCVTPWTIRNAVVAHVLIPVATGDGKVLVGAYNDKVVDPSFQNGYYYGTWLRPEESIPSIAQQFPASSCAAACEVVRDGTYRTIAIQWIQDHVDKTPLLLGLHAINMWRITSEEADMPFNRFPARLSSKLVIDLMKWITPLVFALALLGLIVTARRWREWLLIYGMIALTIVQSIALYGISRFRAPIEPMLLLLATGAVWWLLTLLSKYKKAP